MVAQLVKATAAEGVALVMAKPRPETVRLAPPLDAVFGRGAKDATGAMGDNVRDVLKIRVYV